MWVERMMPPESTVMTVLCIPMMKHSSSTVGGNRMRP